MGKQLFEAFLARWPEKKHRIKCFSTWWLAISAVTFFLIMFAGHTNIGNSDILDVLVGSLTMGFFLRIISWEKTDRGLRDWHSHR